MLRIRMNSKHANLVLNYEPHGIKNRQASSINEEANRSTQYDFLQMWGHSWMWIWLLGIWICCWFCKDAPWNCKVSWIFSWPEICTMFTVCYSLLSLFTSSVRKTMSGDWYNWSTYLMNSQDWIVGQRDSECVQVGKWWPMIFLGNKYIMEKIHFSFWTKIGSCAKFAINIILKNRSNSSSRFPLTDKFH